jgi:hypothetical protein
MKLLSITFSVSLHLVFPSCPIVFKQVYNRIKRSNIVSYLANSNNKVQIVFCTYVKILQIICRLLLVFVLLIEKFNNFCSIYLLFKLILFSNSLCYIIKHNTVLINYSSLFHNDYFFLEH